MVGVSGADELWDGVVFSFWWLDWCLFMPLGILPSSFVQAVSLFPQAHSFMFGAPFSLFRIYFPVFRTNLVRPAP